MIVICMCGRGDMAGDCGSVFMALMQCLKATVSVTKGIRVCRRDSVYKGDVE